MSGVLSSSSRRAGVTILGRLCVKRTGFRRTNPTWRRLETLLSIPKNSESRWSHSEPEEAPDVPFAPSTISVTSEENATTKSEERREFGTQHPNYELKEHYKFNHHHALDSERSYRTVSEFDSNGKRWWTATFTCPLTKLEFPAGTVEEFKPRMVFENKIYYVRKKLAVHAASARAVDYFQFVEKGKDAPKLCMEDPATMEIRTTSREMETAAETETLPVKDSSGDKVYVSPHGPNEVEMIATSEPIPAPKLEKKGLGWTDYTAYHDSSDDDYTIHHVSGSGALTGKTTMERVMNAWAQTVASPSLAVTQKPTSSSPTTLPLPLSWNPSAQRKAAMDEAATWYNSLRPPRRRPKSAGRQRTVFRTGNLVPQSVEASNSLLKALATANQQSLSFGDETHVSVEPMAKQILDNLWKCSAEIPNADTYNAFLKCLSGTPEEVARRAEGILNSMYRGDDAPVAKKGSLPKPNVETFNTVAQLWCRVAGQVSLDSINRIHQLLSKSRNGAEYAVYANKKTFLSIVSFMANGLDEEDVNGYPTYFTQDRAMQFVDRAISTLKDNEEWLDTELYNAPLRWSGGGYTRTCSRPIPWDRHHEIFSNGLKEASKDDDELASEARRMEEWLKEMKRKEKTAPDIETYESVIQAWVRTGTMDGVLQAESIALEVLGDSGALFPRLQTFHPIFAAWVFSGHESGPNKVEEWIERLENLSNSVPATKPDGRIKTLPIKAWLQRQRRVLLEAGNRSSIQDEASPPQAEMQRNENEATPFVTLGPAQACTIELKNLCDELRQEQEESSDPAFFLEGSVFIDVIHAWGNVALEAMSRNGAQEKTAATISLHDAIAQIVQTVNLYDDMIESYRFTEENPSKEASLANLDCRHGDFEQWSARQLRHLMCSAPRIYASTVDILNELDGLAEAQDSEAGFSVEDGRERLFMTYLPRAEMMLRRSEEYRVALSSGLYRNAPSNSDMILDDSSASMSNGGRVQQQQYNDSTIVYDDLYSYSSVESRSVTDSSVAYDTLPLYSHILTGCKNMALPRSVGDATRLCMLILDFVAHHSKSDSTIEIDITDLCAGIVSVLGSNILNTMERRAILTGISSFAQTVEEATGSNHSKWRRTEKQPRETESDDVNSIQPSSDANAMYYPRVSLDRATILERIESFLVDDATTVVTNRSETTNYPAVPTGGKRRRGRRKKLANRKQ